VNVITFKLLAKRALQAFTTVQSKPDFSWIVRHRRWNSLATFLI
jgi:hypothetical protein